MDPITVSFLTTLGYNIATNVGSNLIYDAGKVSSKKVIDTLKPKVVAKVIANVVQTFPEFQNLDEHLKAWIESENLRVLAVSVDASRGFSEWEPLINATVENFVATTKFFSGDQTNDAARKIIEVFFIILCAELHQETDFKQDVDIELSRQMLSELRSMKGNVPSLVAREDGIVPDGKELELHAKIDAARELIKSGSPRAALSLLQNLRGRSTAESSPDLLFRIALYTAGCYFHLEDWTAAEDEYELALRLRPDNLKALVNIANFYAHRKLSLKALPHIEKAFGISPNDTLVRAVRLLIFQDLNRLDELESELSAKDLMDSIDGAEALAQIAIEKNDFETAIANYQKVLDRDKTNSQAKVLMASALVSPIEIQFDRGRSRTSPLSPDEQKSLAHAEDLLGLAIGEQSASEFGILAARTRLMRASVRELLGKFKDAIMDCEAIPVDNKLHIVGRRAKSALLILHGEAEEGEKLLMELVAVKPPRIDVIIPLADMYLKRKDFERAIELLVQFHGPDQTEDLRLASIERLLHAYWRQGESEKCSSLVEQLRKFASPFDIQAAAIEALYLLRSNDYDSADKLLSEGIEKSTDPSQKELLKRKLLYVRSLAGKFEQALATYEDITAPELATGEIATLASELDSHGRSKEALAILEKFRETSGPTQGITEIEINILISIGSFEKAKDLLSVLAAFDPSNYHLQIDLAKLAWRLGEESVARSIIEAIDQSKMSHDAEALIKLAYAWLSLGEKSRVIPLAYRARKLSLSEPQSHLAYVDLFRRSIDKLDVGEATNDTTVTLKRTTSNETLTYTIVERRDELSDITEIEATDQLATRLLNKKIGEIVVMRDDQYGKVEYEVTALRHKYVTAFQECWSTFTTRFPDEHGIRAIEDPEYIQFFLEIERQHKHVSDSLRMYRSREIGFELAAQLAGMSVIDFWLATVFAAQGVIQAFEGTTASLDGQIVNVDSSDELVFDLTALMNIIHVGLEHNLLSLGKPILISQFTFDELNAALFDLLDRPISYAGKVGNRYTISQVTEEVHKQRRHVLQRARNFVKENAKIVGVSKALEHDPSELEQAYNVIGRSAYSSLLASLEDNRCLISDDIVLRHLLNQRNDSTGAALYPLISFMKQANLVTDEQFHESICKLALSNYSFLPVRAETLVYPLEKNHGTVDRTASTMIYLLSDPIIQNENAAAIAAEFLRAMYFRIVIPDKRKWIIQTLLAALGRRPDAKKTLTLLKSFVPQLFGFMPVHEKEIQLEIACFEATYTMRRS